MDDSFCGFRSRRSVMTRNPSPICFMCVCVCVCVTVFIPFFLVEQVKDSEHGRNIKKNEILPPKKRRLALEKRPKKLVLRGVPQRLAEASEIVHQTPGKHTHTQTHTLTHSHTHTHTHTGTKEMREHLDEHTIHVRQASFLLAGGRLHCRPMTGI